MAHSDDDGLVLPPRVAPTHIIILPVIPKPETREAVLDAANRLAAALRAQSVWGAPLEVEVDTRDLHGGTKAWEWIKKGVPLRVEIGPRDIEKGTVAVARRDQAPKTKTFPMTAEFIAQAPGLLQEIQAGLFERATLFRDAHMRAIDSEDEFRAFFTPDNAAKPEIHGGFALCHWAGSSDDENRLREELKVTIRCIPFGDQFAQDGTCFFTGRPSSRRLVFAKSY